MSTEELQKEIWFLYGLWYRYYLLYTFLRENKRELELVSKLQENKMSFYGLLILQKTNFKSASKWFGTAKKRTKRKLSSFFIQSEGLVCNHALACM